MKKRYYLSMLSIFPLILVFDIVYFGLHKSLNIFLITTLAHFVLFCILNFPGTYFLYKPIDQIFVQRIHTGPGAKRIHNLTWYSTGWVFIIGIIYVAFSLFFLFFFVAETGVVSTERMPPIFYLSMISSSLFVFAVFPAFITYFLINDFTLDLKEKAFTLYHMSFPVGKKRVGLTLFFVFLILGFLPTALVIIDLLVFSNVESQYSEFTSFSLVGSVLIDRFIVLVGMVYAIVLVTRSFTKPIYSLLETIHRVSDGDYSTRAAVIADNEIGLLTENFNDMVSDLEKSYQKQEEYSHTLEKNLKQLQVEITERERAEKLAHEQQEKLFQSEKMASVGILVSGVAHEVNNPNNFILLNSDNLADVWNDLLPFLDNYSKENKNFRIAGLMYSEVRDEVTMIINGIKEGSLRIKKIVQTLKDFARKDPGNLDQMVIISDVIDASVTILTSLIKKHTDQFSVDLKEKLPPIKGNIQQVEQVIINLISNACHALENREQTISISASVKNDFIEISVRDKGRGIAQEELRYIMDPFYTTKRDTGGTGLGLSISYNIIKEHGGELLIQSEVGHGTSALIRLPV